MTLFTGPDPKREFPHPLIPDSQNNTDVFTPYEAENMDYIYEQILYKNSLLLEANGETFQIWRKKKTGQRCDNPDCGASKNLEGAPNANCPRCLGTAWIGGFDYLGETLIRVAPESLMFSIDRSGVMKTSAPKSWTGPNPGLSSFDVLVAVDRDQLVQQDRIVDQPIWRDKEMTGTFLDPLDVSGEFTGNENTTVVLKVSDKAGSHNDYRPGIDYVLSNNGILWLQSSIANRPDILNTYFVSFRRSASFYRRFEVESVKESIWRGKVLHQDINLKELEVSNSAYRNIQIAPFDMTRAYYPFPYSPWVERDLYGC